jgi:hypothetical protein
MPFVGFPHAICWVPAGVPTWELCWKLRGRAIIHACIHTASTRRKRSSSFTSHCFGVCSVPFSHRALFTTIHTRSVFTSCFICNNTHSFRFVASSFLVSVWRVSMCRCGYVSMCRVSVCRCAGVSMCRCVYVSTYRCVGVSVCLCVYVPVYLCPCVVRSHLCAVDTRPRHQSEMMKR